MADKQKQDKDISTGEKIFDWAVYGGIAGLGTFFSTIPIAMWMKYGGGAKHYDGAQKWLNEHNIKGPISNALLSATITMQGGNLMILPVAVAEHYKVPIVQKLNTMVGDKTDPASIEKAPKTTPLGLAGSRILAWTMVFTGFMAAMFTFPLSFATFESEFGQRFCQLMRKPTHTDPKVEALPLAKKIAKAEKYAASETKTFRFGRIGALDIFATAAATSLLYAVSRVFAEKSSDSYPHRGLPPLTHLAHKKPAATQADSAPTGPGTQVSSINRSDEMLAAPPALSNGIAN